MWSLDRYDSCVTPTIPVVVFIIVVLSSFVMESIGYCKLAFLYYHMTRPLLYPSTPRHLSQGYIPAGHLPSGHVHLPSGHLIPEHVPHRTYPEILKS